MLSSSVRVMVALVVGAVAMSVRAAELPIIAKARAYIGSESAIESVRAIHHQGTLVTNDPADPSKQTRATIEIVLQKPHQQRVTITSDTAVETTALDGYDGWTRVASVADPTKWNLTLLGVDQIKRLRANTWENLAFFRGIERIGGTVKDEGTTVVNGVTCHRVAFIHAPNMVFTRFFDVGTGRVVMTETESSTIREQGEIIVNGLRFPKSIVTVYKNPGGPERTVTITFDKITVNETFAPDYFAVPSLVTRAAQ